MVGRDAENFLPNQEPDFDSWLRYGMAMGWCGPAVCETHDGLPMSRDEEDLFFEGNDPCIHVIRLYEDEAKRVDVEQNHSPSQWRKPLRGSN
jgi:hypothetical protein